jgi:hypothetical protein
VNQESQHEVPGRAELESRYELARQQRQELRRKMDAIKQEVADDVDRNWSSMWRTDEMFEVQLSARLSSHEEYRSLVGQVRDVEAVEAVLAEELDRTGKGEPT